MSRQDENEQQQAVTPPVVRLAAAEVDVVAAKDRLNDTVARLQSKLDPKLLAKEARDEARRVGEKGVGYARENQSIIGGLAGGVLLYLIGRPLLRALFRRRKGPKPQKAAKPMTATASNERLARQPHPTHYTPAMEEPNRSTARALHPTHYAPEAQSGEGASSQGLNA